MAAPTRINTRKRTRYLYWRAAEHYIQRPMMGQVRAEDTISVKLGDSLEPDRLAILTLPDDEAVRLAARIAHLVGYRLIKMESGAATDVRAGRIHKATAGTDPGHCAICGQRIKSVPGGAGPTWVHSDTGTVAAPNPPDATARAGNHASRERER